MKGLATLVWWLFEVIAGLFQVLCIGVMFYLFVRGAGALITLQLTYFLAMALLVLIVGGLCFHAHNARRFARTRQGKSNE